MKRYLLDTSIASVLAPGRSDKGATAVIPWLQEHEPDLFLSAVTIIEIASGIERLARAGSTRKRPEFSAWLSDLLVLFAARILPVDSDVALVAGRLDAVVIAKGRNPGLADIVIVATGEVHGLTILTRNLRHFLPLGVPAIDPFEELPESWT